MNRRLPFLSSFAVRAFAASALVTTASYAQDEPPPLPPPLPPPPGDPAAPSPSAAPPPSPGARPAPRVREAPPEYVHAERPTPAPLGRTGFQLALRSGVTIPLGQLEQGSDLADTFAWQVPIFFDVGAKPNKHLFLGGYMGFGLGGSGDGPNGCAINSNRCVGFSYRMGFQIQYHAAPDERLNPWVGYGIGLQYASLDTRTNNRDLLLTTFGWEYARVMLGLDVRISRTIGLGPYADFVVGEYTRASFRQRGMSADSSIANGAPHFWFSIGPRLVFFP